MYLPPNRLVCSKVRFPDIAKQGLTELPMTLADELAGLLRGSAKVTTPELLAALRSGSV